MTISDFDNNKANHAANEGESDNVKPIILKRKRKSLQQQQICNPHKLGGSHGPIEGKIAVDWHTVSMHKVNPYKKAEL